MKITKRKEVGGLWVLVLLIGLNLMVFSQDTIALQNDFSESIYPALDDYIEIPEMFIDTDEDFGPAEWNFPGDGSPGNPFIIENYNVTSGGPFGILIDASGGPHAFNVSFIIRNCIVTALEVCIKIVDAYPNLVKIENCICSGTIAGDGIGIHLVRCDGAILTDNTCNFNHHTGIRLDTTAGAVLTGNTCQNNGDEGIYLDNASDNCILNSNTLTLNVYGFWDQISHGTLLNYNVIANNSFEGILVYDSSNVVIENNTIETNGGVSADGIYFSNADNAQVIFNEIIGNGGYGLNMDENSNYNVIHHNNFIQNNQGGVQGKEDYTTGHQNATWYDVAIQEGNFWFDYVGPGVYNIDGTCANTDPFPLGSQVIITTIVIPEFSLNLIGLILTLSIFGLVIIFIKRK